MAFQFDATLKEIARDRLTDFVAAFHMPPNPSGVLNVDLSTLSAATDVAYGFGDPLESITDLNFQSGQDADLADRVLLYNAALHFRYGVPVRSVIILLRPASDHKRLTGRLNYAVTGQTGKLEFEYEVIRLWKVPVEQLLAGGPGVLPLAMLCRMPKGGSIKQKMTAIVREIERRLLAELPRSKAATLMTAAFILSGARVKRHTLAQIFQGVGLMLDSSAYEIILDEGRIDHAKRVITRFGRPRLGPPDKATRSALDAIRDVERLDRMIDAVSTVSNWQELLATP